MSEQVLNLVAVQPRVGVEDYLSEQAFDRKMTEISDALFAKLPKGAPGQTLVVFPEYFSSFLALTDQPALKGFDLSGGTVEEAISRMALRKAPHLLKAMVQGGTTNLNEAVFYMITPNLHQRIRDHFSRFASRHQATVVAGSAAMCPVKPSTRDLPEPEMESSHFYNTAYVFSPQGQCLSAVRKVNMVPTQEDLMGVAAEASATQKPLQTPVGKLGVCICYDGFSVAHTHHEPGFTPLAQVLDAEGAEVIAWPSANPWPWEEEWVFDPPGERRLRKTQWMQEGLETGLKDLKNVRFVLNPHVVGKVLDASFDGQSSILERQGHKVNVLARAVSKDEQEVLVVTAQAG